MRFVLTRREALGSPDGVNIFIVALAQALSDLEHEVRVVVGSLESHAEYRRLLAPRLDLSILALSRTRLTGLASAAAWLRAKWAIDRFGPDLVIHSEAVPLPLRSATVQIVHDLGLAVGYSRLSGGLFGASAPSAATMWSPRRRSFVTNSSAILRGRRTSLS